VAENQRWRRWIEPYDPLDYGNLARSVVEALFSQPQCSLPPEDSFTGAGVYAIYYCGPFEPYRPIANGKSPIYVGKAIPAGARKGRAIHAEPTGTPLFGRLGEHAETIGVAENLDLGDFKCRFLVVVPVWISLSERFLVEYYKPVWNVLVDGFGNHDPGKGRKDMKRPRWDIIHPGRTWAARLKPAESSASILQDVKEFLDERARR